MFIGANWLHTFAETLHQEGFLIMRLAGAILGIVLISAFGKTSQKTFLVEIGDKQKEGGNDYKGE